VAPIGAPRRADEVPLADIGLAALAQAAPASAAAASAPAAVGAASVAGPPDRSALVRRLVPHRRIAAADLPRSPP